MENLEEELNFFGYTDSEKQNPYSFFKYGENADQKYVVEFEGFKKLNEETLNYWMPSLYTSQP